MSTVSDTIAVLPAGRWQVDTVHSQVGFAVELTGGTFRGSFSPVEATLEVDDYGHAQLTGSTRAENIKVQDENLNAHLLAPDFLDAERAPEISFVSEDVRVAGRDLAIAGELTIKGIGRPVELVGRIGEPIVDAYEREHLSLTVATTIDRTQFGLDWNVPLPSGEPALGNHVTLTAELHLIKA